MLHTDPITGEPRLVVPGRDARLRERGHGCPFCAGGKSQTPDETGRVDGDDGAWSARSFPNRYPLTEPHELVVPTPRHITRWRDVTLPELQRALGLLFTRRRVLAQAAPDGYVHCFVNDGGAAGASIQHVHAQLTAVPRGEWSQRLTRGVLDPASCALCELLAERPQLIVQRGRHHAIVAHPVPRLAGALLVVPCTHKTQLPDGSLAELAEFVHRAWLALPPDVAANLWLVADETAARAHWYLELQPRGTNLAGLELALGLNVTTSTAEATAEAARERLAMHR